MPDTLIKTLKTPWSVGGKKATEIEVRPATMQDVCDAEGSASAYQPNNFSVQLACLQVVRAGDFAGPFVPGHFKAMRPAQFGEITAALEEVNKLGED